MSEKDVDRSRVDESMVVADRRVEYLLAGGSDGPLRAVFEYGTPGTRRLSSQLTAAAQRAGYALLVVERPGYGSTTRRSGRRVVDVVDDVVAVVDALGWDRFAVWGGSGGAPHALALAAMLPDRIKACASVVGLAPYDVPELDWYTGMSPGNVEEFTLAAKGEDAYRPLVQRLAEDAVAEVTAGGVQVAADYDLPESDRHALERRQAEPDYVDRMRVTYTGGVDGWVDDCMAFTRPWGFKVSDIKVPVSVWYGEADVLSPRPHAEYLISTFPGAERYPLSGGHVLDDDDLASVYRWLTQRSQPSA